MQNEAKKPAAALEPSPLKRDLPPPELPPPPAKKTDTSLRKEKKKKLKQSSQSEIAPEPRIEHFPGAQLHIETQPTSHLPSTDAAFHDWYLAKIADCFEAEIDGLNTADAPVGPKVLLQALESSLSLFSPAERRAAVLAGLTATKDAVS